MPLSRYLKIYPCPDKADSFIVYSTRKGSLIRVSSALLAAAREGTLGEADRRTLSRLAVFTEDLDAERNEMLSTVDRANRSTSRFKAIIVLNLDCNLACPYCYEDPFRGRHYMSAATAGQLIETLVDNQLRQDRDVQLDFYGGEALLSKSLLTKIAAALSDAAHSHGRKFSFGMVTNGTLLTRSTVEELLPLGFTGAKVTLDGPKEIHDRQRPFISGNGSFDTIVSNLKGVWDLIDLQIGGNFSPDNYRQFPRLLDHLLKEGLTPDKVGLIQFSPIIPKAAKSAEISFVSGCTSSADAWLAEAALFLREETLKRGYAVHKPAMAACMVEFDDYMAVNYDGRLFKCPAFIGWPELSVGTLTDGISDYSVSHNLNLWKNEQCLDCSYLPICFGGCRFLTLVKNNAIEGLDCRKEFFDATLEQIVIQDLRYRAGKKPKERSQTAQT
ncbi:radical SAM domain iron-sulfur cluster-binding oxidoreductase [Geotalea daltonii FRC-32]|uniref:Radical SAM domain iron-sulfur cluster-binding oxidoreductase n=1 Tax=Geotalea daltonii (strain DSM 22248 / JCM 15807 / FRC-32) TaxID=316067 RepID=B9M497_GEODF|nr:geopeptide radical SAM maturase [Geotalea daltonii]ACM21552.1 radical SAM domain iron-sulfur cluster-binding oxidoreductase [Geotalea daltonii FRC-32]